MISNKVFVLLACCVASIHSAGAATMTLRIADGPGVGFNDPTPVVPVGRNFGTTLGQQRINAFEEAARIWGSYLTSNVQIRVAMEWSSSMSCSSSSAALGGASVNEYFADSSGAITPNRWYPKALANKLAGIDLDPFTEDMSASFNANLGKNGCLTGSPFYLGLDNNVGSGIDLVAVLLHEFAHGLGFSSTTGGWTGNLFMNTPNVWDDFLLDTSSSKLWSGMSASERVASATNTNKLVWIGNNVTSGLTAVLTPGVPALTVTSPANAAVSYSVGPASFGPTLSSPGVSGEVMPAEAPCMAFSTTSAAVLKGKIVLIDLGGCPFTTQIKNAQDAGAIAVILADTVQSSPPGALDGMDTSITVPSVRITLEDGKALKVALAKRSRLHSGVFATLGVNQSLYQGADLANRALMYAPRPFRNGSSVSHFDVSASRNLLMEPALNSDLTHSLTIPNDLTLQLLRDIGW